MTRIQDLQAFNAPNTPDVSNGRGAPMGRRSVTPDHAKAVIGNSGSWVLGLDDVYGQAKLATTIDVAKGRKVKVALQRIRIDTGGYDRGGAYWGLGAPLYGAGSDCGGVDLWFRAANRIAAKAHVLSLFPGAGFFN